MWNKNQRSYNIFNYSNFRFIKNERFSKNVDLNIGLAQKALVCGTIITWTFKLTIYPMTENLSLFTLLYNTTWEQFNCYLCENIGFYFSNCNEILGSFKTVCKILTEIIVLINIEYRVWFG